MFRFCLRIESIFFRVFVLSDGVVIYFVFVERRCLDFWGGYGFFKFCLGFYFVYDIGFYYFFSLLLVFLRFLGLGCVGAGFGVY